MLTVAAGVGERILRVPRFEDEKEQFLDFIRKLRNDYEDDHHILVDLFEKFQRNELSKVFNYADTKHISNLSLKRIGKVRQSLESQLKQILPQTSRIESNNSESICKLLTLSAFYPDIAFKLSKRNHYLLPGGISAESQKESMQYVESLETILSKHSENGFSIASSSSPAKALVFEELFDAGHTMVVKSSVVDPIFSVLFADSVLVLHKTIFIDNWIRITSDHSDSLKILLEMRELWKKLSRQALSLKNEAIISQLNRFLSAISGIWNAQREVIIK